MAGSRAARLTKEREEQRAEYERIRDQIKADNSVKDMAHKFSSATDQADDDFRKRTVGLVTLSEFLSAREAADLALSSRPEITASSSSGGVGIKAVTKRKKETLSFALDENEEAAPPVVKKRAKDPSVDTSFLPDRARDEEIVREKRRFEDEWRVEQHRVRGEELEVTYSYWDGSGHRKRISAKKGSSIGSFLTACRQQLLPEINELRIISPDNLMYIKAFKIISCRVSYVVITNKTYVCSPCRKIS
jgi:protein FAM50